MGAQMIRVVLADNQVIFRLGLGNVMALERDLRVVASLPDCSQLNRTIKTFTGSVIIVASTLCPDFPGVLASARAAGSRVIMIAENGQLPPPEVFSGIHGLFFRDVGSATLIVGVRRVSRGERVIHRVRPTGNVLSDDTEGIRVRDSFTPKEMKVVALIFEGDNYREIAVRLKTSEQMIKNHVGKIYDKVGVSDRLELGLFIIHHRSLAEAAAEICRSMEDKSAKAA
jgi:DNA-binding NarL/FixJ family response regulator